MHGSIRDPFLGAAKAINGSGKEVVCVDIPSGWDTEKGRYPLCPLLAPSDTNPGNIYDNGVIPSVIVSLMMPKKYIENCRQALRGKVRHFIGGRFMPRSIAIAHNLSPPIYTGSNQFVECEIE